MIDPVQLIEWSYSGKSEYDANVYNRLAEVIDRNFDIDEIFLQGSYANSTGVFSSSDVDIVVVCSGYYINSYNWKTDLKRLKYDLFDAIDRSYNFQFELGKKTIKYKGSPNYSPVDILPCIQYGSKEGHGIAFYDHSKNRYVVNYPKQHKENGIEKNKRTNGSYKKIVRVFKNLRDYLIDEDELEEDIAPSYYVECLLYNVPDYCYVDYVPDSFFNVTRWLSKNFGSMFCVKCQNEITDLFDSYNGWNMSDFYKFLNAVCRWS